MTRARALLVAVTLAAATLSSPLAYADEAAARAHFRKGVELYDKRQYAEALESFKAAYAEKPSAGIKQNIALCLRGLGRSIEAATAFDEALDEGEGTLKPETRAAIQRELAELDKVVATVHLKVVDADNKPLEGAVVSVDGVALSPAAARRPIRLAQGIHTFTAHVEGLPDPPAKKLALLLGQPVDATFVVAGGQGQVGASSTLNVRANVDDAVIRLDGVDVGRGTWSGKLPPGSHQLEVSAPEHRTAVIDVTVPAGATIDYPIALTKVGEAPGPYDHVDRQAPRAKKLYIVPMLAGEIASYRLSAVLDEPPSGTRRGFGGVAVGVRGGYRLSKVIAAELHAEVGVLTAKYKVKDTDALDTQTTVGHWQLTPVIRFSTPGKLRFTAGTGFGVHGGSVEAKLIRGPQTVDKKGSGVGLSWLVDLGAQVDAGPVFLEGALFFDVHGVGAVRDRETDERFLQASPAARMGLRLGLGIPF